MTGVSIRFAPHTTFRRELESRVDAYFAATNQPRRGLPVVYFKTALIAGWAIASYILLVFVTDVWWQAVLASASLSLAVAAIAFNIPHDGSHGSYSPYAGVNRLAAFALDLLGGSSYLWHWKHDVLHHSYPNVVGADEDIDLGRLARLAPAQAYRPLHRFQHLYLWVLYGFVVIKWQLVDDFRELIQGRVGLRRIPRPRGRELWLLAGGKVAFATIWFVVPLSLHPIWVVGVAYLAIGFVFGFVLGVVLQLAHCVEGAAFTVRPREQERISNEWDVHQVVSTSDFAQDNRLLTWYLGGLNLQIEHHLLPKISHRHYPDLIPIVKSVCAAHGVRYRVHAGFWVAVMAHYRWLRGLARPPVTS